jgi:hypothetical protein
MIFIIYIIAAVNISFRAAIYSLLINKIMHGSWYKFIWILLPTKDHQTVRDYKHQSFEMETPVACVRMNNISFSYKE